MNKQHLKSKKRFHQKILGTTMRLRISVFRSHKHIYAQLIDDKARQTLAHSSTLPSQTQTRTKKAAFIVGEALALIARAKGLTCLATLDRGKKPYAGRIESFAEGARNGGLIF